ncbi:MAG: hypothetical protein IT480_10095 [Gammaproteobacteria bacterium]|nr:hypothetical protein [Gammaproteobacteria bacterium]
MEYAAARGWRWQLEAYEKRYARPHVRFENLLNGQVLLPELKPDRRRVAPRQALARGIELTVLHRLGDSLDAWLSGSWSSARERTTAGWDARGWDRPWSATFGLSAERGGWEWSAVLGARSGWPSTQMELVAMDPALARPMGRPAALRLGTFVAVDLRIARHWRIGQAGTLSGFLEAANVTGRRNPCCVEYEVNSDSGAPELETQRLDYPRPLASLGVAWRY